MEPLDPPDSRVVPLAELGVRLAPLRLSPPEVLRDMERSLGAHGQRSAVVCGRAGRGALELADGFKRLHAARALGWPTLRAEVHDVTGADAKLLLWQSNARQILTDLEEAWIVRALYRDDKLTQPRIAQLLRRDKSWVCRRLLLAEGLTEAVEADVRLGLLTATAAREVARLPRGNQEDVAHVITRRGLTSRQTSRLVDQLLAATGEDARRSLLAEAERASSPMPSARGTSGRRPATPGELVMSDVAALYARAVRLQVRLLERPLASLGPDAERIVTEQLRGLEGVLLSLGKVVQSALADASRGSEEVSLGKS